MANTKKGTSGKKDDTKEAVEALRHAADVLEKSVEGGKTGAKKPAAKKPAAKQAAAKTTAKSGAKTEPKKPAAKKSAPKAKEEPAEEQEPIIEATDKPAAVEEPVVTQPEEQEPIIEATDKPAAEEEAEQPASAEEPAPVEEPAPAEEAAPVEEPAPAEEAAPVEPAKEPAPAKKSGVAAKTNKLISKWSLPVFIVVNSLLGLCALFMMIGAFDISVGKTGSEWYSLFGYLAKGDEIIPLFTGVSLGWAKGAYVLVGMLMFFAFIVPLALVVKNVLLFFMKKDRDVHLIDGLISYAFIVAYLGVVNLFGANMTWAHILSLIIAIVLLAFDILVKLAGGNGKLPVYSFCVLLLIMVVMFIVTAAPVYKVGGKGFYAAGAASESGGAAFGFIMLLATLAALVLLIVMQFKKLPAILELVVPAVVAGCALVALIAYGAGKPSTIEVGGFKVDVDMSMGGGFVFGAIFVMLLAAADIAFLLVPQLKKLRVKILDCEGSAPAAAVEVPAEDAPVQPGPAKCSSCGAETDGSSAYCTKCGAKLK